MNFANTPPKSWTQRLVELTFGGPQDTRRQTWFGNAHDANAPEPETGLEQAPPSPDPEIGPVWVEQKARSAIEAFKDVLTDGTRLFCEQNVHPIYVLDRCTRYRVTGIQVFVPREKSSFLHRLETLPIEVRNRMARILVMGSPGAKEQLVIDDGFFGISLDVEPAVIDGQPIRLIASWSLDSAEIKLVFSGQYISVEPKPTQPIVEAKPPQPEQEPDPVSLTEVVQTAAVADASEPVAIPSSPVKSSPVMKRVAPNETPLGLPRNAATGIDTPLTKPSLRQIALVRMQYAGQDQETTVAITQDMLPFVIGREHTSTGRFMHGISLVDPKDPNHGMLVSREHLELNRYDPDSSTFYFVNHGYSRNGSYHMGSALSEKFMLKTQAPNNVIHLGGSGGVGTVRITIEAV